MSLLDDVSIVVTPNGYKAGTLYGVLPTATEGSDLVTNGGFDTDSDWDKKNGSTISGGVGNVIAKASLHLSSLNWSLNQNVGMVLGKRYKISFSARQTGGTGNFQVGQGYQKGFDQSITSVFVNYSFYINPLNYGGNTGKISIGGATNGDTFEVDNVSVKEWTASDMDVTRATAATRVDENGLVNYAEVLGSQIVTGTNSDMSGANSWVAGIGSLAFDINTTVSDRMWCNFTSGNQQVKLANKLTIGKTYLISLTARLNSGTATTVMVGGFTSNQASNAVLNITPTSTTTTYTGYIICDNVDLSIGIITANNNGSDYEFDNVSVKELARDNVPRIDYTGGGCPHILAEPQRTNLVTYSSDFTDSSWNLDVNSANLTRTPNAATSPSGEENATKLIGNNTSNDPNNSYIGVSTSAAAPYTGSIFAKKGEYDYLVSGIGSYAGGYYAIFNLSNGTVSTSPTASGTTASIEDYGNGWYRCLVNTTNTGGGELLFISPSVDGTLTTNYTNTTNGIYVWGGQVENGSYATSYIPTSGSTVTRNQDQFTRDGISSLINSTEGVLFAEMSALANDGTFRIISLSDGTGSNRLWLYFTVGSNLIQVFDGTTIMAHTIDVTNMIKVAAVFDSNGTRMWVNGSQVGSNSYVGFSGFDRLNFSSESGSNNFFGKIKQVQVYDTALTDSELATLTTI